LHATIIVQHVLVTFALATFAALIVYLRPADQPFRVTKSKWKIIAPSFRDVTDATRTHPDRRPHFTFLEGRFALRRASNLLPIGLTSLLRDDARP